MAIFTVFKVTRLQKEFYKHWYINDICTLALYIRQEYQCIYIFSKIPCHPAKTLEGDHGLLGVWFEFVYGAPCCQSAAMHCHEKGIRTKPIHVQENVVQDVSIWWYLIRAQNFPKRISLIGSERFI